MLPARRPGGRAPSSGRRPRSRTLVATATEPPASPSDDRGSAGTRSRPAGRERHGERDHRDGGRPHGAVHQVVCCTREGQVDGTALLAPAGGRGSVVRVVTAAPSAPARVSTRRRRCVLGAGQARDSTTVAPGLRPRHPDPHAARRTRQREARPTIATTGGEQREALAGSARDRERRPLHVAVEGHRPALPGSVHDWPGASALMPSCPHVRGCRACRPTRAPGVEAESPCHTEEEPRGGVGGREGRVRTEGGVHRGGGEEEALDTQLAARSRAPSPRRSR